MSKKHTLDRNQQILTHEIGHNLGFADQYYLERTKADPIFTSYHHRDSIMLNSEEGLSCGDVDGLINLIDMTLQLKRDHGNAWKSFCPASQETYYKGMSSLANRYLLLVKGDSCVVEEYEKGEKISQRTYKFTRQPFDIWHEPKEVETLQYDGAGRAAHVLGSGGEDMYYTYWQEYERIERLVVKDGKALFFEIAQTIQLARGHENYKINKQFYVGDREGWIIGQHGESIRAAHYGESMEGAKSSIMEMVMQFNVGARQPLVTWYGDVKNSLAIQRVMDSFSDELWLDKTGLAKEEFVQHSRTWASAWINAINPCQSPKKFCKNDDLNPEKNKRKKGLPPTKSKRTK